MVVIIMMIIMLAMMMMIIVGKPLAQRAIPADVSQGDNDINDRPDDDDDDDDVDHDNDDDLVWDEKLDPGLNEMVDGPDDGAAQLEDGEQHGCHGQVIIWPLKIFVGEISQHSSPILSEYW